MRGRLQRNDQIAHEVSERVPPHVQRAEVGRRRGREQLALERLDVPIGQIDLRCLGGEGDRPGGVAGRELGIEDLEMGASLLHRLDVAGDVAHGVATEPQRLEPSEGAQLCSERGEVRDLVVAQRQLLQIGTGLYEIVDGNGSEGAVVELKVIGLARREGILRKNVGER